MRDGWVEKTLGDVVKLGKGGSWGQDSPAEFLSEVICLRGTDLADLIEKKIPAAPTRWAKESELKKSRCQPNMVVIETSGSKCGRSIVLTEEILGLFPLPVIYSNFCRTLEIATEMVSNRYIELWFSHNYQNGLIPSYRATSAMPNLDVKALLRVESIPIPPLPEQKRIVDLISSVDSYIEALRQQLESAKISRNAVLHELLTVGGEDWVNSRLGDLVSYSIGGIWGEEPGGSEVDVPVYRQTEFNNSGILTTPAEAFRSVSTSQLRSRILQEGDVLIQKSAGTPSLPGRVAYVSNLDDEVATFSNFLSLLRPDQEKCLSRFAFLVFWTKHWTGRAFQHQRGTNIKNLHLTGYLQEQILLPPLHEQKRIVDVISSFDSLLVCLQQQIDSTMGVRSGLLSDLLSGKHEIPASYDQLIGAA